MIKYWVFGVALLCATGGQAAQPTEARKLECGVNYMTLMVLTTQISEQPGVSEADKKSLIAASQILAERSMSVMNVQDSKQVSPAVMTAVKTRIEFVQQNPDANVETVIGLRKQCDEELAFTPK
jgi:hypothetical protein